MNVRKSQGPLVYKNPFLSEVKTKFASSCQRRDSSPRAGHLVKVPPTRATRTVCQERFACKRPLRIAAYDCSDCRTLQCDACETLIHENPKNLFHERRKLQFPSENIICQLNCETKNLADVFCKACDKRLCFACDLLTHQYKSSKDHYRVTFELDEFFSISQGQTSLNEVGETEEYRSWNDQDFHSIVPQSPDVEYIEEKLSFDHDIVNSITPDSKSPPSSIGDYSSMQSMHSIPDVLSSTEQISSGLRKLSITNDDPPFKSFLLVNDKESLQVGSEDDFIKLLGCMPDTHLKVISIFGNTGEGKSYTLNHTFFNGTEVFQTNDTQESCTVGVWAAFDKKLDLLILDTEGLLGVTENQNKRSRLLMKILALSDIIIYRTRAERLHNDLFTFLGDSSKAYVHHFSKELQAAMKRFNLEGCVSSLGPAVLIFHETINTKVLTANEQWKRPEDQLMFRFREFDLSIDAFSKIEYVGTQTKKGTTSFQSLSESIKNTLNNNTVRSTRTPDVIYQLLKALNNKFSGDIDKTIPSSFLMEYLTCNTSCQSCNRRCMHSTNHILEGVAHSSSENCKYQHQFDNKIYLCRMCYERGDPVQVVPKTSSSQESTWLGLVKYAWSGYVIECPKCGVIYRSREYWYGNRDPCESCVRTEVCHVWPGGTTASQLNPNVARRVIDSVSCISDVVTSISAKPTKTISSWVADQLAPSYWTPNYLITHCTKCEKEFMQADNKHHCRSCGKGFCEDCSSKTRTVPERGWGNTLVRVCDDCYLEDKHDSPSISEDTAVTARRVGEVIHGAIETVALGINYPISVIKDSARPSYWVADENIKDCIVCKSAFSVKLSLHHCRACGQGVCESCSTTLKPVPSRGWDYPVRVCDACSQKPDL